MHSAQDEQRCCIREKAYTVGNSCWSCPLPGAVHQTLKGYTPTQTFWGDRLEEQYHSGIYIEWLAREAP